MEDLKMDEDVGSEEIPHSFMCCVCWDLLYKPIVLSCGHISCFWCVHRSMSGLRESRCPICRHPYIHFPTICQMLHFLFLKMYPVAYKRRENQIQDEEMKQGLFSPQFNKKTCKDWGDPADFSTMVFGSNSSSDPSSTKKGEPYAKELSMSDSQVQDDGTGTLVEISDGNSEVIRNIAVEEEVEISDGNSEVIRNIAVEEEYCKQVSVADVLCLACKQLLFRPLVLNCGHVFCESCISIPEGEMLKCQVCQTSHPRGFPKVCLELDHFLEERFPEEYVLRRDAVQLKQVDVKHKHTAICSAETGGQGKNLPHWFDPHSKVHIGFGCDSCGICPIIGDRYKCTDCKEKIGFDLCGDCYNTRSKLPGRFNQQHTPEHKFELVRSNQQHTPEHKFELVRSNFPNILRLLTVELEDNTVIASEDSENESPASTLSSDAQENAENNLADSATSHDAGGDQTGSQSTS